MKRENRQLLMARLAALKDQAVELSNVHGMNFVRQDLRLALYLRDGCACGYCNSSISDEKSKSPFATAKNKDRTEVITLDHLKPRSKGGSHAPTNLVTSCKSCNDFRGNMDLKNFVGEVAARTKTDPAKIMAHVTATAARPFDRSLAKELIAKRGSSAQAMASGDAQKAASKAAPGGNSTDQRRTVSGRRGPGGKGGWRGGAKGKPK